MPSSITPEAQAASAEFMKAEAQKNGEGAPNAPGHTEGKKPGEAPVASKSGKSNVRVTPGTHIPGYEGFRGPVGGRRPKNSKEVKGVEK